MWDIFHQLNDVWKQFGDVLSLATVVAVLTAMIPALSAILSLVWLSMRVYESYLNIKQLKERNNANQRLD